jgi:hypothetical protein
VRSKKNKGKAAKIEISSSTSTPVAAAVDKAPTPHGQHESSEAEFINYDFVSSF